MFPAWEPLIPPDRSTTMPRNKHLSVPAYLVAALLILIPLLDTALSVFPPRMSDVSWRFGATGLFSRALMTPLLGLLIAFAVALLVDQRRVLRVIAVVSGISAAMLVGTVILFTLDALQMRSQVRIEAKSAFDVASAVALAKYGLCILVLAAFTVAGWKSARRERKSASHAAREKGDTAGLIVRPSAAKL